MLGDTFSKPGGVKTDHIWFQIKHSEYSGSAKCHIFNGFISQMPAIAMIYIYKGRKSICLQLFNTKETRTVYRRKSLGEEVLSSKILESSTIMFLPASNNVCPHELRVLGPLVARLEDGSKYLCLLTMAFNILIIFLLKIDSFPHIINLDCRFPPSTPPNFLPPLPSRSTPSLSLGRKQAGV